MLYGSHESAADSQLLARIQSLVERPPLPPAEQRSAVEQLAEGGAATVAAVLAAMRGPFSAGQHPHDVMDTLGWILAEVAKRDPAPLIDVLDRDAARPDPDLTFVVSALGYARPAEVVNALRRAQRHRNPYVRAEAASSLARFSNKAVAAAMVEALRDRSSSVQWVAVQALLRRKALRSPAAIPFLERIVRNASIRKHSPGMWDAARQLLDEMLALLVSAHTI